MTSAHDTNHDHPHPHPHEPAANGRPMFTGATPILNVASVPASLDYYTRMLGFGVTFAWSNDTQFAGGAPPTYAQVARGQFSLALAQQTQGGPGMWIYLDLATLADLDALHHEYQHSGARIAEPPSDKPWNRREMLVNDLDGHTLRIGAPLPHNH